MASSAPMALAKQTWRDFSDDNATRLAAALAYYTMFSLAPLLVIAVVVLSVVMRNNGNAQERVVHYFTSTAQGIDPNTVRTIIQHAASHGSGILATVIAAVITLFGAFGFFTNLQGALNTVWEVKLRPDLSYWDTIKNRVIAFLIVGAFLLVLLGTLGVTTWITGFAQGLAGGVFGRVLAYVVDIIGSFIIYCGVFMVIFKFIPDVRIAWKDVWVGSALTAVLFLIGKYALSVYLSKGSSTSVFGAAGSLAALLIWIYYSAQIVLFGAEFTQVYARRNGEEIQPDDDAERIGAEDVQGKRSEKPEQQPVDEGVYERNPRYPRERAMIGARHVNRGGARDGAGNVIAACGIALGVTAGVAGWMKNRHDPVREAKLKLAKLRLDQLERRLSSIQHHERRVKEMDVDQRLVDTHHELHRALREMHKGIYSRRGDEKRSWKETLLNAIR